MGVCDLLCMHKLTLKLWSTGTAWTCATEAPRSGFVNFIRSERLLDDIRSQGTNLGPNQLAGSLQSGAEEYHKQIEAEHSSSGDKACELMRPAQKCGSEQTVGPLRSKGPVVEAEGTRHDHRTRERQYQKTGGLRVLKELAKALKALDTLCTCAIACNRLYALTRERALYWKSWEASNG